jgi:hypothetical protein
MAKQENKTEAQIVYERIEELKAGGSNLADAVKTVAKERGKKAGAVRANYYNHAKKLTGGGGSKPRSRRSTRAAITVDGAVDEAKAVLQKAIDNIDGEVQDAKTELDAAQARYDELMASVKERKASLEKRIEALS